jgi:uncharacterized protein (TIGR02996 family)
VSRHAVHPQELALLAAIHEAPRDDSLRLVYADWLEERGNPLGELVRWQVSSKRRVAVHVGRTGTRFAGLLGPRQGEALSPDAPRFSLDEGRLRDIILPQADRWLRPFPPESRHCKPQACFERGIPCVEWSGHYILDLGPLQAIGRRLLPHLRVNGLILPLDSLRVGVESVLGHPALTRVNRLAVPKEAGPELLQAFISRLADTDLPDRLERLVFLGWDADVEANAVIRGCATRLLAHRMRLDNLD